MCLLFDFKVPKILLPECTDDLFIFSLILMFFRISISSYFLLVWKFDSTMSAQDSHTEGAPKQYFKGVVKQVLNFKFVLKLTFVIIEDV